MTLPERSDVAEAPVRHVLEHRSGKFYIRRDRLDTDMGMWDFAGYLNKGVGFASRSDARDYMRSEVER